MTAKKKKTEETPEPVTAKERFSPAVGQTPTAARRSEPKKAESKTINWTHVHLSVRKAHKWVRISHKYDPSQHAELCQKLRDGYLGGGYYIQFENPLAAPGSSQEVLHPHEIHRVNFDTLDSFVLQNPRPVPVETEANAYD